MIRTQIQLTEKQARKLRSISERQGVSRAELIRRAVDRAIASEGLPDQEEIRERARMVVGKYTDTATDVSIRHDDYLAEAYGE
ncbi:MAG: ribbon-helix-helix protein, CopG family [Armatimonadota bacterium]